MSGLTILVATADQARFRSALGLALSHIALGGTARLFLDAAAVMLVRSPIVGGDDAIQAAGGMPALAGLVDEALDAGARVTLCQAGMAMAGTTAGDFDARIEFGGLVGVLAALGEDRLVVV